ncbi:MAG: hypothetical protein ACRD3G_01675 [Vicinamibacterales bacterium]
MAIAWFLVENIIWFRASSLAAADAEHVVYRLHVYHLHLAMIKRSVGLFSGFALLFLGTAVVFYTLRRHSNVNIGGAGFSAGVMTASPGIIAMALGVAVLLGTIGSKDEFPPYTGESTLAESRTTEDGEPLTVVPFVRGEKE